MQIGPTENEILRGIARQHHANVSALADAIEHESDVELAQTLKITLAEAEQRMARIRRAVTVGDDWGAGCKLLTDDVRAELHAALRALG